MRSSVFNTAYLILLLFMISILSLSCSRAVNCAFKGCPKSAKTPDISDENDVHSSEAIPTDRRIEELDIKITSILNRLDLIEAFNSLTSKTMSLIEERLAFLENSVNEHDTALNQFDQKLSDISNGMSEALGMINNLNTELRIELESLLEENSELLALEFLTKIEELYAELAVFEQSSDEKTLALAEEIARVRMELLAEIEQLDGVDEMLIQRILDLEANYLELSKSSAKLSKRLTAFQRSQRLINNSFRISLFSMNHKISEIQSELQNHIDINQLNMQTIILSIQAIEAAIDGESGLKTMMSEMQVKLSQLEASLGELQDESNETEEVLNELIDSFESRVTEIVTSIDSLRPLITAKSECYLNLIQMEGQWSDESEFYFYQELTCDGQSIRIMIP